MNSQSLAISYSPSLTDYLSLLKPRVMSLVVFTGFVGLYIAPGDIHPFIAFIAILCIALGSGAAGAINMWYERDIDSLMKRTKNRPLPAGRVDPESALEFASVLAFASVFVMAFAVNYLAAAILLFSIFFYVFVYTMWLKPITPQNIVIGGLPGAMPPLIGWVAVTGNIALEPLILVLIIFMWTPPHFWAISLYCHDDYKKAGIPMLPIAKGIHETKRQILIYTLLLSIIALIPAFINMAGNFYLGGAVFLGLIFIYHAIQVYRTNDENASRAMFQFSLLYLAGIFTFLIFDK